MAPKGRRLTLVYVDLIGGGCAAVARTLWSGMGRGNSNRLQCKDIGGVSCVRCWLVSIRCKGNVGRFICTEHPLRYRGNVNRLIRTFGAPKNVIPFVFGTITLPHFLHITIHTYVNANLCNPTNRGTIVHTVDHNITHSRPQSTAYTEMVNHTCSGGVGHSVPGKAAATSGGAPGRGCDGVSDAPPVASMVASGAVPCVTHHVK
jgi:hypothetical protein